MARKNRGIVRREKIVINGREIEVDTFDAKVVLGSGDELESIGELLKEEEYKMREFGEWDQDQHQFS